VRSLTQMPGHLMSSMRIVSSDTVMADKNQLETKIQLPLFEDKTMLPTGKWHDGSVLQEVYCWLSGDDRLQKINKQTSSGIYAIVNLANKKCYFGSTHNLSTRLATHKYRLKNGKHSNKHLQNSWDYYGAHKFLFLPIASVAINNLLLVEQDILDLLSTKFDQTYNICEEAKSRLGCRESEEIRKKKSKRYSGSGNPMWGRKHSKATKELIQKKAQGRKHSEATKRKIAALNRGKTHSKETKRKISLKAAGEANAFFGKRHKKESIEKMKQSRKKYNRPVMAIHLHTGEKRHFNSIAQAAQTLGLQTSGICRVLSKKYSHTRFWKFTDVQ